MRVKLIDTALKRLLTENEVPFFKSGTGDRDIADIMEIITS